MTDPIFRKTHIGGSDIPTILGISPWSTILDLWAEKIGQKPPMEANPYMKRGIALEPEARAAYMKFTGNLISPVEDMESRTHSYCSASLDGWTPAGDLVVEIKCPTGTKTLLLAKEGKIQANYYAQIQWQLFVSEKAKMADFWVYHVKKDENGERVIQTALIKGIEENKEFQEVAFKAAEKFHEAMTGDFSPDPNYLVQEAKALLAQVEIVASTDREYLEVQSNSFSKKKADSYKQVSKEIDEMKAVLKELEFEQKKLRLALIDEGDGGNFIIEGIKFCAVQPKDKIEWEKVVKSLNIDITPEQLAPFTKKGNPYYKVSLI